MLRSLHSRRLFRKLLTVAIIVVCIVAVIGIWFNHLVDVSATGCIYSDPNLIPYNRAAIVLGCPATDRQGRPSLTYRNRIEAAAQLYHRGQVSYIIASGSAGQPWQMRADLVARGVPGEDIRQDDGGYRTLASIIRARDIFGLKSFTVVTQPGHAARAIYLAKSYGLEAVAFSARDPRRARDLAREYLAHVKAVLDVYILHRHPSLPDRSIRTTEELEWCSGRNVRASSL